MNDQLRKRGQESLSDPPHSRPASARSKSLDEFDSAFKPRSSVPKSYRLRHADGKVDAEPRANSKEPALSVSKGRPAADGESCSPPARDELSRVEDRGAVTPRSSGAQAQATATPAAL